MSPVGLRAAPSLTEAPVPWRGAYGWIASIWPPREVGRRRDSVRLPRHSGWLAYDAIALPYRLRSAASPPCCCAAQAMGIRPNGSSSTIRALRFVRSVHKPGPSRRQSGSSWRVPERVPERIGGVDARDPDHGLSRGLGVVDDYLSLSRVAVPLERDRESVGVAGIDFNEHSRDLSGVVSNDR